MKLCPFCLSNNLLIGEPIFENTSYYVVGMIDPERAHALMIIPKAHSETPFDIGPAEWTALSEPLAFAKDWLSAFNPSGFSVGWNVGASAGQHVEHVHLHVICRFDGEASTGLGINALIRRVNGDTQSQ